MGIGTRIALSVIGGLLAATTVFGAAVALPHALGRSANHPTVQQMQSYAQQNGARRGPGYGAHMYGNTQGTPRMQRQYTPQAPRMQRQYAPQNGYGPGMMGR